MRAFVACLVWSAFTFGAGSAFGGYLSYFGQDLGFSQLPLIENPNSSAADTAFRAAVNGEAVETFEGQTTGATGPLAVTLSTGAGPVTATLSGGNGVISAVTPGTTNDGFRYSVPSATSSKFWEVDVLTGDFYVRFNAAMTALGFYGVDVGEFGGQLFLDVLRADDSVMASLAVPLTSGSQGSTEGNVLFYGFLGQSISDDFYGVRFRMINGGSNEDLIAFDNLTVAGRIRDVSPVPEPSSLALLACGLIAAGASRRRSKP